jgi:hypothetical protein
MAIAATAATEIVTATMAIITEASVMVRFYAIRPGARRTLHLEQKRNIYNPAVSANATNRLH